MESQLSEVLLIVSISNCLRKATGDGKETTLKTLSANGANIPAIGLGTFQLQGDACTELVQTALNGGYNHVDTAALYENEEAVGAGIRASGRNRDDLFITTKVWPSEVHEGAFQQSVEASLERLGLDQVDLLLIHWPPKDTDIPGWASLLDEAVDRGWTRHIGVSNFTTSLLRPMATAVRHPLVANQVENHPYLDQSKLRQCCADLGMALIAYCPLYKGGRLFEEPDVVDMAKAKGKTAAQIILRWHLQHDGAGAIPKTATPGRLQENIDIFDFELSARDMAALSALTVSNSRLCDYDGSPDWDRP